MISIMRQKMKTKIHLYPCRDCKLVPPQGPETLQGQQYQQCLETKPTKMREILNTQQSLKQPRCYLNDLILLSNQHHGLINTSSRHNGGQKNIPLWQVLSKELCYIRILLLITVLFMIGFGFIPSFPLPVPAMFQYKQDSFPPTNFFTLVLCNLF